MTEIPILYEGYGEGMLECIDLDSLGKTEREIKWF